MIKLVVPIVRQTRTGRMTLPNRSKAEISDALTSMTKNSEINRKSRGQKVSQG